MPINHVTFNDQLPHGRMARAVINKLEEACDGLLDVYNCMKEMLDGDGSQEAHFTAYVLSKYGFSSAADAKVFFDGVKNISDRVNTNAASSNNAATIQALINRTR
jgi:hypothetical protein